MPRMDEEIKGDITSRYLFAWMRDRVAKGLGIDVKQLHDYFEKLTRQATRDHEQVLEDGGLWELSNELHEEFLRIVDRRGKTELFPPRISDGYFRLAHILLIYIRLEQGMRIDNSFREMIDTEAKRLDIDIHDAHAFMQQLAGEMITVAYNRIQDQ